MNLDYASALPVYAFTSCGSCFALSSVLFCLNTVEKGAKQRCLFFFFFPMDLRLLLYDIRDGIYLKET